MALPIITFLLVLGFAEAALQPAPNCPDRCGDAIIPFPFGIGPSCYLDKGFEVVCNTTFNPPTPFLRSINLEMLQIQIYTAKVIVNSPIIYQNCSNKTGSGGGGGVSLEGSPFVFSATENKFIATGCDNYATMARIDPLILGCKSDCNKSCQTTIPTGLEIFEVDFGNSKESCKSAFLVDDEWFALPTSSSSLQKYRKFVPVVLYWSISDLNGNSSKIFETMGYTWDNRTAWAAWNTSDSSSRCFYTSLYLKNPRINCKCEDGYEGNPYILAGCKDTVLSPKSSVSAVGAAPISVWSLLVGLVVASFSRF